MATVPDLVHHYDALSSHLNGSSYYCRSPRDLPFLPPLEYQKSCPDLRLDFSSTMFTLSRSSSEHSSIASDRSSVSASSETASTYGSPSSLHSSPTFSSADSCKYQSTGTSHHMNSLPQFSMANMQGLMKTLPQDQTTRPRTKSKRWLTHRSLSRTLLDMENEMNGDGIESAGLGLFEPRPIKTTVSRQSTQGSVVLDGIFEVMNGR